MNYLKHHLCYVEEFLNSYILYFTDNIKDTWGDDWNDRPASSNAGEPYRDLVNITTLFLRLPYGINKTFGGDNYSAEELNKGIAPWLSLNNYHFTSSTTYEEVINIVKTYNNEHKFDKITLYKEDFNANN